MNTQKKIKLLIIQFQNSLLLCDVSAFRGAIISKVPADLTLFHNHIGDNLRYRYPLIQYKRIHGKAAIICVGEGTETIGSFFSQADFKLKIGKREEDFVVESIRANQWLLQPWDTEFQYTLRKWLPLNSANYEKYMSLDSVVEKYAMLEKILIGNVLSFAKGIGVHFEQQVVCKIIAIEEPRPLLYKGVKMMAFDLDFKTNVSLPDYIGLGKGVSLGFGMVVRKYDKKN